jgi:hypothetical protein
MRLHDPADSNKPDCSPIRMKSAADFWSILVTFLYYWVARFLCKYIPSLYLCLSPRIPLFMFSILVLPHTSHLCSLSLCYYTHHIHVHYPCATTHITFMFIILALLHTSHLCSSNIVLYFTERIHQNAKTLSAVPCSNWFTGILIMHAKLVRTSGKGLWLSFFHVTVIYAKAFNSPKRWAARCSFPEIWIKFISSE